MTIIDTANHVYSGKSKSFYETAETGVYTMVFRNDATAFDGKLHKIIRGKGVVCNQFNALFMGELSGKGIANHLIGKISEDASEVRKLDMIPLEFIVRNLAAGSIVRRLGIKPGAKFKQPVSELNYKSDTRGDPMVDPSTPPALGWKHSEHIENARRIAIKANRVLSDFLGGRGIELVDIKFEFGLDEKNRLLVGDEITPDACRLWDQKSGEIYDKDVFRHQQGDLLEAYTALAERLDLALPRPTLSRVGQK